MSIRVPSLLGNIRMPLPPTRSTTQSIALLVQLLQRGKTTILTGAGISVDSGIRPYRGKGGSYNDTTKIHRPIFYGEFVQSEAMRRRYWARSYLGFPAVRIAEPNPSHFAVAALQKMGLVRVITQNVDGLHHKAIDNPSYRSSSDSIHSLTSSYQSYLNAPTVPSFSNPSPANNILELHGTLRHAHCLSCQNVVGRDSFQDSLSVLNPDWSQYADQVSQGTREERLNPDGDVELGSGVKYENFVVPNCVKCQGPMKPKVTFFGESLSPQVRDISQNWIKESNQILIIGSTLATFSAFRLVRQKKEEGGEIMLLNVGESRGDAIASERLNVECGTILPAVAREIFERLKFTLEEDVREQVEVMLRSGVVKAVSPFSSSATS